MTAPITGQSHQAVEITPEWLEEEVAETYGNLEHGARQEGTLWERAAASPSTPRLRALAFSVAVQARQARPMTLGGPGMTVEQAQRALTIRLTGATAGGGIMRAGVRVR